MVQVVCRWHLTAEARVSRPCGICGRQSASGTGFSPNSLVFPVNVIPPWLSILILIMGGGGMNKRSIHGHSS